MMKKRFLALLAACAAALTACAGNTPVENPHPVDEPAVTGDEPAQEPDSVPEYDTAESTGEALPEVSSWEPLELSNFSGADGLQTVKLPFEAVNLSTACGSLVLAVSNCVNGICSAAVIDTEALTYTTAEVPIGVGDNDIYTCVTPWFLGGCPLVTDMFSGEVVLFDRNLNELDRIMLEGTDFTASPSTDQCSIGFKHYNEARVTWVSIENNRLAITEGAIETDMLVNQLLPLSESESLISCFDNTIWDNNYFLTDGKEITPINISGSVNVFVINGRLGINNFIDNEITIYERNSLVKKTFSYPAGSWLITGGSSGSSLYFAWQGKGQHKLFRMSPENGNTTAQITIPFDNSQPSYLGYLSETDGGVLVQGCFDDREQVLLWKPENITSAESWGAVRTENYTKLCEELARELEETYNITVQYGNEAVRYFTQYAVVSETNERRIYSALTSVKSVLGKFPEGFIKELTEYMSMDILLTGSILSNGISRDSITTACAFTESDFDARTETVVLDISLAYIEKDLPHELMHVIEDTMYYVSIDNPYQIYDMFSRWSMLNPEDFEYAYVYTYEDGTTIDWYGGCVGVYFCDGEMSADDVYFVDGYSTTYPKEDRARLFENLFCYSDELPAYFSGKNIRLKTNYLCLCIRECFDSLRDCEDIIWEHGVPMEHDLDWYIENYDYTYGAVG